MHHKYIRKVYEDIYTVMFQRERKRMHHKYTWKVDEDSYTVMFQRERENAPQTYLEGR